jgi:hypothetical protein
MGREIKRVAVDFDWPLDKEWDGYVNPYYKPCPEQNNTCFNGYTAAGGWLDCICDLIALLYEQALNKPRVGCTYPHPFLEDQPHRVTNSDGMTIPPSSDLITLLEAFTKTKCVSAYSLASALIKAAGVKEDWGTCPICNGDNIDPTYKESYEKWEQTDPPKGEGWQIWETVSHGSPVSPVFATKEELVEYLIEGGDIWDRRRGTGGYSRKQAEAFVNSGWAPSAVIKRGHC